MFCNSNISLEWCLESVELSLFVAEKFELAVAGTGEESRGDGAVCYPQDSGQMTCTDIQVFTFNNVLNK